MTRIIGIELRAYTSNGWRQEITVVPVDISLPDSDRSVRFDFDVTLHTSNCGDYTIPQGWNGIIPHPDAFPTADRRAGS
jgi:hypothetical protein